MKHRRLFSNSPLERNGYLLGFIWMLMLQYQFAKLAWTQNFYKTLMDILFGLMDIWVGNNFGFGVGNIQWVTYLYLLEAGRWTWRENVRQMMISFLDQIDPYQHMMRYCRRSVKIKHYDVFLTKFETCPWPISEMFLSYIQRVWPILDGDLNLLHISIHILILSETFGPILDGLRPILDLFEQCISYFWLTFEE